MDDDEQALVSAYLAGRDEDAFRRLYHRGAAGASRIAHRGRGLAPPSASPALRRGGDPPLLRRIRFPRMAHEYRAWARDLRDRQVAISGVKLKSGPSPLSGYFVIRARSLEEARRIAASCPHVQHGGTIEVREIDKV